MPTIKRTEFNDTFQGNFPAWKKRDEGKKFHKGFPRAPNMDDLGRATDKAKYITHQVQQLEVSTSDALVAQGDQIRGNGDLIRGNGHSIRRLRSQVETLASKFDNLLAQLDASLARNKELAQQVGNLELITSGLKTVVRKSVSTILQARDMTADLLDKGLPSDDSVAMVLVSLRRDDFVPDEVDYLLERDSESDQEIGEGEDGEDLETEAFTSDGDEDSQEEEDSSLEEDSQEEEDSSL
jgi:hypothetical protein